MEILPKQPTVAGPAEMFTGNVHLNVIARGEEPSQVRVNTVRFAPAPAPPGTPTRWGRRCT